MWQEPRVASGDARPIDTMLGSKAKCLSGSNRPVTVGYEGSFVHAAVRAYNEHNVLVLTPDVVWQSIVTQFAFWFSKQGAVYRHKFVDQKVKQEIRVQEFGWLCSVPWEAVADKIVEQIIEKVKCPDFIKALMPSFSTTTAADRMAAAISVMSVGSSFFEYYCDLLCGFAGVELRGTLGDWAELRSKVAVFEPFVELTPWLDKLRPVVNNMYQSKLMGVDADWWQSMVNYKAGMSGPDYVSGWIKVFMAFKSNGEYRGDQDKIPMGEVGSFVLTADLLVTEDYDVYETKLHAGQVRYRISDHQIEPVNDWVIALE